MIIGRGQGRAFGVPLDSPNCSAHSPNENSQNTTGTDGWRGVHLNAIPSGRGVYLNAPPSTRGDVEKIGATGVCVFYYCRTYYKAVRVGGGGEGPVRNPVL
jgi:hypothetical protein